MKNYSNEIAELESKIAIAAAEQRLLETSNNEKVKGVLDYYFNYFKEMAINLKSIKNLFKKD